MDGYEMFDIIAERDSLRAELDRVRQDAERLDWLANRGGCPFAETDPAWDTPEGLRKEIDEAIAYEKKQARVESDSTP